MAYQWFSEWESGWNTINWDTVWHPSGGSQASPAHASDSMVGRALYTTPGDNRRGVGSFVHFNTLGITASNEKWVRCDTYTHSNDPIFNDRNHRWFMIGGGSGMGEIPTGGENSIDTGWQFRLNPHHDRSSYYQSSNYPEGNNLFPAGGPWLQMYAYVHHANGETWGSHTNNPWGIELFAIDDATNNLVTVDANSWLTCVIRVVLNSPGTNNGRIELWVDKHNGQGFRYCRPFTDVRFSTADNRQPSVIGHDCIISGGDGGSTVPYDFHVDFQRWAVGSSSLLIGPWRDDGGSGPLEPQDAPANVDGSVDGQTAIDWAWDSVSGAEGYEIEFDSDQLSRIDVGDVGSYRDDNLSAGQVRSIRVRAYNDNGGGPWSEAVTLATEESNPGPVPAQPTPDNRFIRYDFDIDAQGWQGGNPTSFVSHVTDPYPTARGAGSLRITRNDSGNWRAESSYLTRDWSDQSSVLGAYVLVPDSAPTGSWEARAEIQSSDNSFTAGALQPIAQGDWSFVSFDFGEIAISDFRRAAIHISGPAITSATSVYVDEYGQGQTDSGIAGDINGDGVVDALDLSILVSHWGTSNTDADLNNDGIVDSIDLSILASNWG